MKTIFLIIIGLSSLSMAEEAPRFKKSNGVVTDSKTTLEWQDDYSDNKGNIKSANWTDAIDYCEGLTLNSQSDWRLPNRKELLSIIDYNTYNPSINSVFQKTISGYYWSSTTDTYSSSATISWYVNFAYGSIDGYMKSSNNYVRCVRGGE